MCKCKCKQPTIKQKVALALNMRGFTGWLKAGKTEECTVGVYVFSRTGHVINIGDTEIKLSSPHVNKLTPDTVVPPKWVTLFRKGMSNACVRTRSIKAYNTQNAIRLMELIQRVEGERRV